MPEKPDAAKKKVIYTGHTYRTHYTCRNFGKADCSESPSSACSSTGPHKPRCPLTWCPRRHPLNVHSCLKSKFATTFFLTKNTSQIIKVNKKKLLNTKKKKKIIFFFYYISRTLGYGKGLYAAKKDVVMWRENRRWVGEGAYPHFEFFFACIPLWYSEVDGRMMDLSCGWMSGQIRKGRQMNEEYVYI